MSGQGRPRDDAYDARKSDDRPKRRPAVHLGTLINAWRRTHQLKLESCAEDIGIDKSALSRLERGEMISHKNFVIVLVWAIGKVSVE